MLAQCGADLNVRNKDDETPTGKLYLLLEPRTSKLLLNLKLIELVGFREYYLLRELEPFLEKGSQRLPGLYNKL